MTRKKQPQLNLHARYIGKIRFWIKLPYFQDKLESFCPGNQFFQINEKIENSKKNSRSSLLEKAVRPLN